jgi:hypothetical protein
MMKAAPKIYLVHAAAVSIPPIVASFHSAWPEARLANLLEDSFMPDLAADGKLTEAMTRPLCAYRSVLCEGRCRRHTVRVFGIRPGDRGMPSSAENPGAEAQRGDVRTARGKRLQREPAGDLSRRRYLRW